MRGTSNRERNCVRSWGALVGFLICHSRQMASLWWLWRMTKSTSDTQGMIEDLLENGSFEETQKEEMRLALDGTLEKSKHRAESALVAG